jgi:glycosyltransferase involved in cell wall biosynthesis
MKVAIIVPSVKFAGPVKVVESLVLCLKTYNNLEVEVLCMDREMDKSLRFPVPVKVLIDNVIHLEEYDIIHTNGLRPDFFAFRNRRRIKCHISTIHNFVFDDLRYRYNPIVSLIFGIIWLYIWRKADKLVCVSDSLRNYYKKFVPAARLVVIHNGLMDENMFNPIDADVMSAVHKFKSNGFNVIGTIANRIKIKGTDQLIKLLSECHELSLVNIGDGRDQKSLERMAKRSKVLNRCFFAGFRKNAEDYLGLFDLFVVPSRTEGFCLSLVEAVRKRVPVVCSEIPVFRELFSEEEVSFFKLGDIEGLKSAVYKSLRAGSIKTNKAYNHFLQSYMGKQMADKYYRLYQSGV